MIKSAAAIASALTIIGAGLPLSAQVNDGDPAVRPTQPSGADDVGLPDGAEDRDGGFVIYPPADSVEDLGPEDILQ